MKEIVWWIFVVSGSALLTNGIARYGEIIAHVQ